MDKSCHVEAQDSYGYLSEMTSDHTGYFAVHGMGCQNCANRIKNSLLALPGVHMAAVYLQEHVAGVVYDPEVQTPEDLERAIFDAGNDGRHVYRAQLLRVLESPTILND